MSPVGTEKCQSFFPEKVKPISIKPKFLVAKFDKIAEFAVSKYGEGQGFVAWYSILPKEKIIHGNICYPFPNNDFSNL